MKSAFAGIAVLLLTGCASGGHCLGEFEYQKAHQLPAAPAVEGIKPADTSSALRIPPAQPQQASYAETYADPENPDKQKVRCLDVPPRMAEPATPPPAPAPAAAEPPVAAEPEKP